MAPNPDNRLNTVRRDDETHKNGYHIFVHQVSVYVSFGVMNDNVGRLIMKTNHQSMQIITQ